MSLYELRDVRVAYGDRVVLDLPHLAIEAGRAYSLQGPNGAGKSTLLGILSFLNAPHHGEVRFGGGAVAWREADLRLLRRKVGLVDQHPVMFSRSVRENVAYGLAIRGIEKNLRHRLAEEALDLVGLRHLADAYAPRLSGGETQRVAIARVLANRPEVLLLDEPTASVDTQNRVIIEQVVAELRDRGETTIVLCTHNRSQAAALCPSVIYLEDGRLADSPMSNSYAGQFQAEAGQTWCRIASAFRVAVPKCGPGRGRVVIEPGAVRLAIVAEPGMNRGPLTRIRLEGDIVSLSVDLGRPLHVQMTLVEFRDAGLEIGALVEADIPPAAVECFQG